MPIETVASLVDVLRQHRLLEAPQMEEAARLAAQPALADPRALARELLNRGWLTAYQVNQIFQGRAGELVLGSYVLLERLGEGGMGLVFKARHAKLGKVVALKIIRQDWLNNAEAVRRFHREILVAAQLSHPNVVHSYDADQIGDRHLIVMEYVDGTDLSRLVRERGPLPVREACEYVRQAALGLQHAHEHGLVHRDVKPSNFLVTKAQGAQSVGVVKVLDLGLARVLSVAGEDTASQLTQAGSIVGTPDFIAPEQARNAHTADIRADLYSLGCTLFWLLTAQPPFPGGSMTEKVLKHHWDPPPAVESLRPDVPPIVAALVRKLMAKRPDDRFPTPAALAAALERLLAPGGLEAPVPPDWVVSGLPAAEPIPAALALPSAEPLLPEAVLATPTSVADATAELPAARPARPARRPPRFGLAIAGIGALVLLGVLAVLVPAFWPRNESKPGSPGARATLPTQAEAAPSPLDRLSRDHVPAAERVALQAREVVAVLGEHRGRHFASVRGLAFAPDGTTVASLGDDGAVRLWDAGTLKARGVFRGGSGGLSCVAFAPDGNTIAAGDWEGKVRLWDLAHDPPRDPTVLSHTGEALTCLAFAPDGRLLAVGRDDYTVQLWELAEKTYPRRAQVLRGHRDEITAVAFSPDGKLLATGSDDHTIRLYDATGARLSRRTTLEGHTESVRALAFSPNSQYLASVGDDRSLRTWDVSGKTVEARDPVTLPASPTSLTFAADRNTVLCGTWDKQIIAYNLRGAQPKERLRLEDTTGVTALAWSAQAQALASGSEGGVIRVWDWNAGQPRQAAPSQGHTARVTSLAFAPDGQTLATASLDGSVRLWDVAGAEPKERAALNGKGALTSVAFSPDGKRIAAGSRHDAMARLWELPASVPRTWPMARHAESRAGAVAFLDARTLAVGGQDEPKDGTVRFWDVGTASPQAGAVLRGHFSQVVALAVNARGTVLASSGGADGSVRVWDYPGRRELHHFFGLKGGLAGPVALSPDARLLVYSSAAPDGGNDKPDYSVFVMDLSAAPPRALPTLPGHTTVVRAIAFDPEGQKLVTADDDGRLILWEASTGKNVQDWRLPGAIYALAFAPDGRHLAVGNGNGTTYILRLKSASRRP